MKKVIHTDNAPKAVGPYSQAIVAGNTLFCSGQIPIDPQTNELLKGSVQEQAHLVMKNLSAVVEAAGFEMKDIVKCGIFLSDMSHFQAVNEVYAEYFEEPFPARACVAVKELPKSVDVEIEAIAYRF